MDDNPHKCAGMGEFYSFRHTNGPDPWPNAKWTAGWWLARWADTLLPPFGPIRFCPWCGINLEGRPN